MFGPKLSMAKWIAAKSLLKEQGIDIDRDLKLYYHGGCCEDIAFNVYLKAVDAGVVCDDFLHEYPDNRKELGVDTDQLAVIGKTNSVPTRVFAARKALNHDLVIQVNQALLDLDTRNASDAKILHPAELGGFFKPGNEDYIGVKSLLDTNDM